MKKDIKNVNAVFCKLRLALTKVINFKFQVTRKKKRKKKQIIKRQKTKIMARKYQKAKEKISLFSKIEKNYKCDLPSRNSGKK